MPLLHQLLQEDRGR